jgi:prepilin-type N-terminal cleavage/methylation domain-containing protein
MYLIKQKGMTLIELTVVLLILVALAGLMLPYISGTSRKALCDATDISMMNIKQVIMERYYLDTLGNFPASKGGSDYSLNYLFTAGGWGAFDLDSQVGWNGPYLQGGLVIDASMISNLSSNFKNTKFTKETFSAGKSIVMDAWGRPIILQIPAVAECKVIFSLASNPTEGYCARLVSAGVGSGLGIGAGDIDTHITDDASTTSIVEGHLMGDDRILYLNAPTPAEDINKSCSDS